LDVLQYAAKHDYSDIADEAAIRTIGVTVDNALKVLSPTCFIAWVRYNQRWQDALFSAYQWSFTDGHDVLFWDDPPKPCDNWAKIYGVICHKLGGKPESLKNLQSIFIVEVGDNSCKYCDKDLAKWQKNITEQIEGIAAFSTFLYI
jgi:hypothetical protein